MFGFDEFSKTLLFTSKAYNLNYLHFPIDFETGAPSEMMISDADLQSELS